MSLLFLSNCVILGLTSPSISFLLLEIKVTIPNSLGMGHVPLNLTLERQKTRVL